MQNNKLKFYFVLFSFLSALLFFHPMIIPLSLLYYTYYGTFLIAMAVAIFGYRRTDNNLFTTPVLLILGAICISALSATFFWSQNILYSYMGILTSMSYILFFLLTVWKTSLKDVEKIIIIIGIIYIITFSITFIAYPVPVFGGKQAYTASRGFQRLLFDGLGFLFLFCFFSLNQYYKNRQLWWLIVFIITVIMIIATLTRTLLASSFMVITLYILRKSSNIKKIFAMIAILAFILIISQMDFFQILVGETKSQIKEIDSEIRIRSLRFFLHDFSPNIIAKIIGNGMPYQDSGYASYVSNLGRSLGYYSSDLGFFGLYVRFGVISILAYFLIIYRTIKVPVHEDYLYCKYFLYFIFICSITVDATFSPKYIPAIALAIYIISHKDVSRSSGNKAQTI